MENSPRIVRRYSWWPGTFYKAMRECEKKGINLTHLSFEREEMWSATFKYPRDGETLSPNALREERIFREYFRFPVAVDQGAISISVGLISALALLSTYIFPKP